MRMELNLKAPQLKGGVFVRVLYLVLLSRRGANVVVQTRVIAETYVPTNLLRLYVARHA